jgi:lipopolysaccharide transport system permease protein
MPLSIVTSNLVRFAVQMLLMVMMMGYYAWKGANFHMTWAISLFPLLILLMALLGLGLGLIITALTTKYRDLAFLVTFGIPLLMYTTTIIYPLSSAPSEYRTIISLNPMTGIIECFRFAFLGEGQLTWWTLGYSIIFTIIALILGILIFNKTEKSFIDTV